MNPDNEPMAVDLAREPDFEAGVLRVRPSLRQVESNGASETLEPRVMQVLVALFRRQGEVVSRDELIQRCWSGRIVGEDAISRCIARVRKLGEANAAFTLETIAKVGYRLVLATGAEVAAKGGTASGSPAADQTGKARQDAPQSSSPPAASLPVGLATVLRRRGVVLGLAGAVVLGAAAIFLFQPRATSKVDVDAVVARLTQRPQQAANPREIAQAGAAVKELRISNKPEERSAFSALASGDTKHAIDVLEDLATGLEAKGDRAAAADVYTRIGAIALVVDQGRGLAARRKAVLLSPQSMRAFQGLFLDTVLLRGGGEALKLAEDTLARPGLSDGMRSWVLAHRGLVETDVSSDSQKAQATRDEIDALYRKTKDPLIEYCSIWLGSLIAISRDDLAGVRQLSARAKAIWPTLSGQISSMTEVGDVRAQLAGGDWTGAVTDGIALLEERGRKGDFLPSPTISDVCVAGVYSGRIVEAEPYCRSLSQRIDNSGDVTTRAFGGLITAALGDAKAATTEFEASEALVPASAPLQPRLHLFEAYAANKRGDLAEAERLVTLAMRQSTDTKAFSTSRSFDANALRLLGEWLIAANQAHKACAPLAESEQLYAAIGGDAGRTAVSSLRSAAKCER